MTAFFTATASLLESLAFQGLDYLMKSDFGASTNAQVVTAVDLATMGGDRAWQREHIRSLQLALIALAEDLDARQTHYSPFRADVHTSQNGVFVMILRIVRHVADGDKSEEAVRFCRDCDCLLAANGKMSAEIVEPTVLRAGAINKSTGRVVTWC